jgi:hypothetical protein
LEDLEDACFGAVVVSGAFSVEMDVATGGSKLDAEIGGITGGDVFAVVEGDPGDGSNVSPTAPSAWLVPMVTLRVLGWGC